MPITPAAKQAIRIHDASFDEKPPLMSDDFAEGSILYRAENSYGPVSVHVLMLTSR